jgi:hypothetical protein
MEKSRANTSFGTAQQKASIRQMDKQRAKTQHLKVSLLKGNSSILWERKLNEMYYNTQFI